MLDLDHHVAGFHFGGFQDLVDGPDRTGRQTRRMQIDQPFVTAAGHQDRLDDFI